MGRWFHVVAVDVESVARAWKKAGRSEFWIRLRFGDALVPIDQLNELLEQVNADFAMLGSDLGDVAGGGAVSAQDSVVIFMYRASTTLDGLRAWCGALASRLGGLVDAVDVSGVTSALLPRWVDAQFDGSMRCVFLLENGRLAEDGVTRGSTGLEWTVDAETTRRTARAIAGWGSTVGETTYLRQGLFNFKVVDPGTAWADPWLPSALAEAGMAGVTTVASAKHAGPLRSAELRADGCALLMAVDDSVPPVDLARAVCDALLPVADVLRLAFVRRGGGISGIGAPDNPGPAFPNSSGWHLMHQIGLYSEFVPDAHGIQILTEQHLSKARSLDNWGVTPIGNDRFVVAANELDPWFATSVVDDQILRQARHDFGSMIADA